MTDFIGLNQKITATDLMDLRQKVDESVTYFIERFIKIPRKCLVQFIDVQYPSMAINAMYPAKREIGWTSMS